MNKFFTWVLIVFVSFFLVSMVFINLNKPPKKEEKVTVAEVAHTVFYAPFYVAIEKGYFSEEGINLNLILTPGADKVTAAVLSGDADIGFCGSEATIYVYNNKEKDYLKTFARLTNKDGTFIVSREKIKDFSLTDLKGKNIIGGRKGGMPEMTLEYALKKNGVKLNEVNIDTSIAFNAMGGAFSSGEGDFVTLFEPEATKIEQEKIGYVVASVGELGGEVPYTAFNARSSYLEKNKKTIKNFSKAINRGLEYVEKHSDKAIAKTIKKQFNDTSLEVLEKVIKRYRNINAWSKSTFFSKKDFDHLQDIMMEAKELDKKVAYEKLIYQE